ncbi:hypothetical protein AC579_241 [Pseudocercospora musae]|uniref:Uncharacterized protein n=1 Tax=Pseudocercospora musae TaxID=113226 RepID=A0A139I0K2_9PEZI|nr:hypothetical protein AC579_241 [Pseudocercospora musae]
MGRIAISAARSSAFMPTPLWKPSTLHRHVEFSRGKLCDARHLEKHIRLVLNTLGDNSGAWPKSAPIKSRTFLILLTSRAVLVPRSPSNAVHLTRPSNESVPRALELARTAIGRFHRIEHVATRCELHATC